ncbi:hypothetical protein BKA56DRAFT_599295 [Ilyonectria sp. MPI-CAGE-AT-0026]|nr:hypothetical protein BKA56DRAFT_599295 [Ilyonectria sp. MPI-CAGE-AT-0026]
MGAALGTALRMSSIAARALDLVRAARKICAGLCLLSCRMVSFPRPILPPVTRMTLPERSGMSLSGLNIGMLVV